MRSAWLAVAIVCVGCREKAAPAAAPIASADAAAAVAVDATAAAPTPDAVILADAGVVAPLGAIERVRFSRRGRLAFVSGHSSFAVVDTKSGTVRRYRGEPPVQRELGFDNRCNVSDRDYLLDGDVSYVDTDANEGVFWRDDSGAWAGAAEKTSVREDFVRGVSLRVRGTGTVHASASIVARGPEEARTTGVIVHEANVVRPLPSGGVVVVDSDDALRRSALVRQNDAKQEDGGVRSTLVLDPLTEPAMSFPLWRGTRFRDLSTWVSFGRSLLVAVLETDEVNRRDLCAFDLTTPGRAPTCARFAMPSPFFRRLVSEDGLRIAFSERVHNRAGDDECFMHVLDRRTGKDTRWKGVCTTTTEVPLRFEGEVLVTDAASIVRCRQSKLRSYDVAAGGRLVKETLGPPAREDVDDKLLALIDKEKTKQKLWAATYGHEQLVTWSEHESVLARDGGKLRICTKRGATCRDVATTEPLDEGTVGGAALDRPVLGAASHGRFVAVDATSGTKLVDVALE